MKELRLSNTDQVALVDDEDYELVCGHNWYITKSGYAARKVRSNEGLSGQAVLLHRYILGLARGVFCDHKDRNRLNNSRSNLRVVTIQQNNWNTGKKSGSVSRFKGVSPSAGKWIASLGRKCVGRYDIEVHAAHAYNLEATRVYSEYAYLNEFTSDELELIKSFKPWTKRVNVSKYKGVTFNKSTRRWVAYTTILNKTKHIGSFLTEDEAHQAVVNFTKP